MVKFLGCGTDDLEDDFDSAFFSIVSSDRKRDSFPVIFNAKDDELAWFGFLGHKWSVYLHLGDGRVKNFL